jgi:hypothetical protein
VKSAELAVATVDRLAPAVERAVDVLEATPKVISAERQAAVKSVQDELTRTILFVQEQRASALKDLHGAMTEERVAMTQDIEQISLKVVDHAFWRAVQLLAAVLVILAIGLAVVLIILKKSQINKS